MTSPDVDQDDVALRLAAGRGMAVRFQPYIADALYAMQPIATTSVQRTSVDQRWRFYYNPAYIAGRTATQIASDWLHGAWHLNVGHAPRAIAHMVPTDQRHLWNQAADAWIANMLRQGDLDIPDDLVLPEDLGLDPAASTEQGYDRLSGQRAAAAPDPSEQAEQGDQEPAGGQDGAPDPHGDPAESTSSETDHGDGQPGEPDPASPEGVSEPQTGGQRPDDEQATTDGQQPDQPAGSGEQDPTGPGSRIDDVDDPASSGQGDSEGEPDPSAPDGDTGAMTAGGDQGDDQPVSDQGDAAAAAGGSEPGDLDGQGTPGAPSDGQPGAGDPTGAGTSWGGAAEEGEAGDPSATSSVGQHAEHDCGSGADHQPRPWEIDEPTPGSISEAQAHNIRARVAEAAAQYASSGRGTIPGSMERWIEDLLHPTVPWERQYRRAQRRGLSSKDGRARTTMEYPRRSNADRRVLEPGETDRKPPISVAVVDASGSMRTDMFTRAMSETDRQARDLARRGRPLTLIVVDAGVTAVKKIRSTRGLRYTGNGGTDMRVGMEAAAALRPRPQMVTVLTDGFTPWPDAPPAGLEKCFWIVVLIPAKHGHKPKPPPHWCHVIEIPTDAA